MTGSRYAIPLAAVLLFGLALGITRGGIGGALTQWLSATLHDARINTVAASERRDGRAVIVAIDEPSLRTEGAWPWPRERVARLIERLLSDYQAAAVGVDILFPEPGRDAAGDERLAAAVADRRVVLSQALRLRRDESAVRSGRLAEPPAVSGSGHDRLPRAAGYVANTADLARAARAGHITPDIASDGVVRRVPALACVDDACFDMLALSLMRVLLGAERIELSAGQSPWGPAYSAHLGGPETGVAVPLDTRMRTALPYRDSSRALVSVSAADVLAERTPLELLRNRPVIIGATATGLADTIATPRGAQIPGVSLHAHLLHALMDRALPVRPAAAPALALLADLAILAVAVAVYTRVALLIAPLALAATAFAYAALNAGLWHGLAIDLPLTEPLVVAAFLLLGLTPLRMFGSDRRWRRLYRQFAAYVPPHVIRQLVRTGADPAQLEAERREVTVLFADLQNFTALGERHEPEQLAALMHRLLTEFTRVIHRHGGTVDKYMGDAVMAFWGAPLADPDHRAHAFAAARELLQAAARLEAELRAEGETVTVQLCMGLHSGSVAVGNFGSAQRRAYTVLGDTVNVTARLQAMASRRGEPLLLSEATRQGLDGDAVQPLGTFELRGRREPVRLFTAAPPPSPEGA